MKSLVESIVEFSEILRQSGVRLSIAETIDAVSSFLYIDILDKNQAYTALAACMAKSEEERKIFHEAFERYFLPLEEKTRWLSQKAAEYEEIRTEVLEQAENLKFQGETINVKDDLKEVYASLPDNEKNGILDFLDKSSNGKNVKKNFKQIVENIVKGKLEKLKSEKRNELVRYSGALDAISSEAGMFSKDIIDTIQKENELYKKNMGNITEEEIPAVLNLIRKLTYDLKRENKRKYKNKGKKLKIDIKKTIRSSMQNGGVPFQLKYKNRPKVRDQIIILSDISSSMYRFSGFVLQFASHLQSVTTQTQSFIFSEDLEHIKMFDFLKEEELINRVEESPLWRRGTNIAIAIEKLISEYGQVLKTSSILLIISDAKTVEGERALINIEKLNKRIKKIIWINPVEEMDWERIPYIDKFLLHSTMLDCSSLEKLERVCRKIYNFK